MSIRAVDGTADGWSAQARVEAFAQAFASEASFRDFYDRTLPKLYGYLISRCHGDAALAEDLAQTTFIEVVRRRSTYDGRADPVTWIIGIARHKLVDHFRTRARNDRRQMRLEVREITAGDAGDPWRDVDDREALSEALAHLAPMHQAVLVLHYADGLPMREVARVLGRSESATESLLARARAAIRTVYGEGSDG